MLAIPNAKLVWKILTHTYQIEQQGRVKESLAATIATVADDEVIGDVIELCRDTREANRVLLLPALGRSKDPRALEALFALRRILISRRRWRPFCAG